MDITEILRKIGDIAVGTPETALSLASGAIAYPAAKFGGALTSAMTGGRGDLAQYAEDYITDKMTYKPTSQSGQEAMNIAGSALSIPYKPAEYVKEKYGYIPGYATEMAINLLMPRLAGRWSEMKAKGLGETGLYGGDLSKTMQEAKAKGEYPPGSFSNLADKKVRMEIDDSGAKLIYDAAKIYDPREFYLNQARTLDSQKKAIVDEFNLKKIDKQTARKQWEAIDAATKKAIDKANEYYTHGQGRASMLGQEFPLIEVLEHPKLYEEYPDLRNLKVSFNDRLPFEGSGSYQNEAISMSLASENPKSTLLHEIQHAIQEKEGFARGGSSSVTSWASSTQRPELLKVAKQTMEEWKPASYETFWGKEITPEGQKAYAQYLKEWNSKEGFEKRWRAAQEGAPAKIYRNLAGEIEARDAAARMNLTPQERMRTGPYTSEDIPLLDWIVRHK